jgi:hypothetical protein
MDLSQVREALTKIFIDEGQRIVFWNDPEIEFIDALPELLQENAASTNGELCKE